MLVGNSRDLSGCCCSKEKVKKNLNASKIAKVFFLMAVYFTISKVDHITLKKTS